MQKSKYDGKKKVFRFPLNLKVRERHKNISTMQLKSVSQHGFNKLCLLLQKSVELHDLTSHADYRCKLLPKLRFKVLITSCENAQMFFLTQTFLIDQFG